MNDEMIKLIAELQMASMTAIKMIDDIINICDSLKSMMIVNRLNAMSIQATTLKMASISLKETGDEKTASMYLNLSEKINTEIIKISSEVTVKINECKKLEDEFDEILKKNNSLN